MKPIVNIIAGRHDITAHLTTRLVSMRLTDETGFISDKVNLVLDDRDDVLALPSLGETLHVSLGYQETRLINMGSFIVDDITCQGLPRVMRINATASNSQLKTKFSGLTAPKSRSWHGYTLFGIVDTIANEHQFKKAIVDKAFEQIYLSHIDQTDESDIAFLQRLAHDMGGFVKPTHQYLCFAHKRRGITASGKSMPVITLKSQDVSHFNLQIAQRGKYGNVIAKWHNIDTGEEEHVTVGDSEPVFSMRHTYATEDRAKRAAHAKYHDVIHGKETLTLTTIGNSKLTSEVRLNVNGVSQKANGHWIITSVTHQLGAGGYTTEIISEKEIQS